MLTLSESQLDALRIPVHRNMRKRLLSDLKSQDAVEDLTGPEPAIAIADRETGAKNRLVFRDDGLPRVIESAAGRKYGLDYSANGLLTGITVPSRAPYRFEYGQDATLEAASQGNDPPYRFAHDKRGEIASVAWPDKRRLQFERHPNGKLSRFTDRTGAVTEYAYDDLFRLTAVSGPLGRRLEFLRERDQNRFSLVYPNGARESIEWMPGTRRFLRKMPDGALIEYALDVKDRVSEILWPGGENAQFTYTAADLPESVRHGEQVLRFRRDSNGNVASEETAAGEVLSVYDRQNRLLRLATPSGESIAYTYDPDGFVTSVSAWNRVIRLTPGKGGQFDEISYGGTVIERRKYGLTGRVEEAQVTGATGAVLSRQSYRYDVCERLVDIRDYDPLNGFSRHLSYDAEDRLVADEGVRFERKYKYDARGNMVQSSAGQNREVTQWGDMDEPVRVDGKKVDYDGRGNLTQWDAPRAALKCRYDARGLMTYCAVGTKVVEFGYDALGRRIRKSSSAGVWRFGWFGLQLLREEFTAPGARPVRRDYLYLPGTFTAIAFRENDRVYWLQNDVRGAVIRAFDENGAVVWHGNYESFGRVQMHGKRIRQPLRLMGQYEDEETGLNYNLARYYSPELRSYFARDPRWYEPWATNYSYSRNDPWNRADPTGGLPAFIAAGLNAAGHAVTATTIAISAGASAVSSAAGAVVSGAAQLATAVVDATKAAASMIKCALLAAGAFIGDIVSSVWNTGVEALKFASVSLSNLALNSMGFVLALGLTTSLAKPLHWLTLGGLEAVTSDPSLLKYDGHIVGAGCSDNSPSGGGVLPSAASRCTANKGKVTYVNGINTKFTPGASTTDSKSGICYTMQTIADITCSEVTGVYDATGGMGSDIAGAELDIEGASQSEATKTLARQIEDSVRSGNEMTVFAHSRGGLITREAIIEAQSQLALDGWSDEEIKQGMSVISVRSFGSAMSGWPPGPNYQQFTNLADPVPQAIAAADLNLRPANLPEADIPDEDQHSFWSPHLNPIDSHNMDDVYLEYYARTQENQ